MTFKTADTDVKQQYLEFRSEGAKTFEPSEGLKVTPYAGVKLRHTLEGGYQERNAGDFNLNMNSGSETAVDSIVGLKLDYAGKESSLNLDAYHWKEDGISDKGVMLNFKKTF